VLRRFRYFLADAGHWIANPRWHLLVIPAVLALAGGIAFGVIIGIDELRKDEPAPAPAPEIIVRTEGEPEAAEDLGFPAFATRNTTRVSGEDPVADAAGVALAAFPSTGGLKGPAAVTLVEENDWPSGIAASVLMAEPVRAPILISGSDEVPDLTQSALRALGPDGSADTGDKQIFKVGAATAPDGPRTASIEGGNPAQIASEIDLVRQRLTKSEPDHILVTTSDEAAVAMPAAGWAARSGDPILFVGRDTAPEPTLEALGRHKNLPVYVLGSKAEISDGVLREIEKAASSEPSRIEGANPVESAINFARYADGTFGWNVNDPGHGFVVASSARPLDAAAASPLSASGSWGPLLITDDATLLPADLRGYLLDVKPGYQDDPTRAVYNHLWVIGNENAVSVAQQAQIDELAELARVRTGTGRDILGPPPGQPEREEPGGGGAGAADRAGGGGGGGGSGDSGPGGSGGGGRP
jgi:hypothetical protein